MISEQGLVPQSWPVSLRPLLAVMWSEAVLLKNPRSPALLEYRDSISFIKNSKLGLSV